MSQVLNCSPRAKGSFPQQLYEYLYGNRWFSGSVSRSFAKKRVLVILLEEGRKQRAEIRGSNVPLCGGVVGGTPAPQSCPWAPRFCLLPPPPSPGSPDTGISLHLMLYKENLYRLGAGNAFCVVLNFRVKSFRSSVQFPAALSAELSPRGGSPSPVRLPRFSPVHPRGSVSSSAPRRANCRAEQGALHI